MANIRIGLRHPFIHTSVAVVVDGVALFGTRAFIGAPVTVVVEPVACDFDAWRHRARARWGLRKIVTNSYAELANAHALASRDITPRGIVGVARGGHAIDNRIAIVVEAIAGLRARANRAGTAEHAVAACGGPALARAGINPARRRGKVFIELPIAVFVATVADITMVGIAAARHTARTDNAVVDETIAIIIELITHFSARSSSRRVTNHTELVGRTHHGTVAQAATHAGLAGVAQPRKPFIHRGIAVVIKPVAALASHRLRDDLRQRGLEF